MVWLSACARSRLTGSFACFDPVITILVVILYFYLNMLVHVIWVYFTAHGILGRVVFGAIAFPVLVLLLRGCASTLCLTLMKVMTLCLSPKKNRYVRLLDLCTCLQDLRKAMNWRTSRFLLMQSPSMQSFIQRPDGGMSFDIPWYRARFPLFLQKAPCCRCIFVWEYLGPLPATRQQLFSKTNTSWIAILLEPRI